MVITFICDVLGEENNGTTIATMNVIRSLRAKGHEVRIVCPDEDKKGKPGYYVVPPIWFGPFKHYVQSNGVCLASSKGLDVVKEALQGADIAHFNFCGFMSGKACDLAHEMGIPCTASLHTQAENFTNHFGLENVYAVNLAVYRKLYRSLFSKVDAIHYPSQFIHDLFEKKNHFHSKSYVISNGIQSAFQREEVERPAEWEGKIVVTYTARYSKEKDHRVLLKAMKYSKHRKDILLVLPGAGPLEHQLRREAKKWCVNEPVFGFHSRADMVKILNCTDIYCHVGTVDIEPVSCLEAISVGIAPVLTDSPRSSVSTFAIDKKLNVYNHRSAKDLARHIDYWIEHPEERKKNADAYLGFASRFDFEKSMDAMEHMFEQTIADYKAKKGQPVK